MILLYIGYHSQVSTNKTLLICMPGSGSPACSSDAERGTTGLVAWKDVLDRSAESMLGGGDLHCSTTAALDHKHQATWRHDNTSDSSAALQASGEDVQKIASWTVTSRKQKLARQKTSHCTTFAAWGNQPAASRDNGYSQSRSWHRKLRGARRMLNIAMRMA